MTTTRRLSIRAQLYALAFSGILALGGLLAVALIIVVTAKDLTATDRAALNGHVLRVVEKASFDGGEFIGEVRRAMHGGAQDR